MKLAISNIAWDTCDDDEMYEFLASRKIEGIEIAPTRIFVENPYERLEEAENYANSIKCKYNLKISSMQSIWFGKKDNIFVPSEAEELRTYTKKAIDFANSMKCSNLVFGCPRNRNIPKGIDVNASREFFKEIGDYADCNNTKFALEPNPTIYSTNFMNTTKETVEVIKNIASNGIGLNLDFGTIIQNHEDINDIKEYMKYINHIHISEPFLDRICKREEHRNLAKILIKKDYKNYISIEMKNLNNVELVKETIEYMIGVFR